jgi:rhodanese-related sulfurtransferase
MRKFLMVMVVLSLMACQSKKEFDTADQMVELALQDVTMIQPAELHNLMGSDEVYTLIDVRQEIEHYYGYIPGSVVLPRGSLEFNIGDEAFWEHEGIYMPGKEEKIIVYCKKGARGILAAETLIRLGYTNVFALEGGWKNWELTFPDVYEKALDKLGGGSTAPKSGGC